MIYRVATRHPDGSIVTGEVRYDYDTQAWVEREDTISPIYYRNAPHPLNVRGHNTVRELHERLQVAEANARCCAARREGKRPGWRLTVTRLSDGKTATRFVAD